MHTVAVYTIYVQNKLEHTQKVQQKDAHCYRNIVQHIHKLDGIFAESILCSIEVGTGICSIRLCLDAAEASKLIPVCAVLGCVLMLLAYAALIHTVMMVSGAWGSCGGPSTVYYSSSEPGSSCGRSMISYASLEPSYVSVGTVPFFLEI